MTPEQILIAALLTDPVKAGLREYIGTLLPTHFKTEIHADLYAAILECFVMGVKQDAASYGVGLENRYRGVRLDLEEHLKQVGGGIAYCKGLAESCVSPLTGINVAREVFKEYMVAARAA